MTELCSKYRLTSLATISLIVVIMLGTKESYQLVLFSSTDTAVFIYDDADYTVQYEFTPTTGTLNDLLVTYNGNFEFLPSDFGGITTFTLAGEALRPWEKKHTTEILETKYENETYIAKFRWSYNSDSLEFTMKLWLENQTLNIEFLSDEAKTTKFEVGRSEQTPNPKVIELPYGHNVLFTSGIFVSAITDRVISKASTSYPQNGIYSNTSALYGYGGEYLPLTDGSRNTLKERIYLTVSPDIHDTFFQVDNPPSPYRAELTNRVVVDLWRNFAEYKQEIQILADSGMTDLFIILHLWQKYGYDNGLPSTYPAGDEYGGDKVLKEVMELCKANDYLCALHTNYVDFYPNSDVWDEADVALDSDGEWIESWLNYITNIQSYLLKPSRALDYAKVWEPLIYQAYGTEAAFIDVHSAIHPSDKVDFDAQVPNAGKQSATYEAYKELLTYVRSVHGGPVAGEGYGSSTHLWAGYIDAIEADPRPISAIHVKGGTDIPTLVDYKLLVLHNLFVAQGVGYLERFYLGKFDNFTQAELDRYRATEIAFGNAGFISNPFAKGISLDETKSQYCFMKHVQSYYLVEQPIEISYYVDGQFVGLSDALRTILPTLSASNLDAPLSEELGILKVEYTNGFEVYVNRTKSRSIPLIKNGRLLTLQANNFLAKKQNEFLAYSAQENGVKTDYICPVEDACGTCSIRFDFVYLPIIIK